MTKSGKPKKPRRWRRRLLWTLGVLLLLVLLSPLLVALGPVRDAIAEKIGETLGRRVEIESAFAFWGKGIDLEGITVHSPDGFDGPLATVKKVHADIDVLALVGGDLSAAVRVIEPHVTYRRNAFDKGNADGVMENLGGDADEPEDKDESSVDVSVVVLGGRVEAPDAAGGSVIDDIQATLKLESAGRTTLSLRAVARGAARDGGDTTIKSEVSRDARGEGPIEVEAPALDLARLAGVVEGATGLRDLGGVLEIDGKGKVLADGTIQGVFRCALEDFAVSTPDGVRVTLRRMRGRADLRSDQGNTECAGTIALGDLRLRETSNGREREVYREPNITLTTTMRYNPKSGTGRIAEGRLDAGGTAVAQVTEPLRIETDPSLRMAGKAFARVNLGRLGHLHALVPALKALGGGTLDMHLDGRSGSGVDAGAVITVTGLRLEPSDIAPEGYSEQRIVLALAGGRDEHGNTTINFERLEGTLLRGTLGEGGRPMQLKIDEQGRWGLDGAFDLILDLYSLSRLLGSDALGLERGERLVGTVRLKGAGRGDANEMQLGAGLGAGGIRFPASWGTGGQPGTLQGTIRVETKADEGRLTIKNLKGMGLTVDATADLARGKQGATLANAEAKIGADLAAARPYFGAKLGVGPTGALAGRIDGSIQVADQGGTLRAVAQDLAATGLVWRKDHTSRAVRQARVELDADVRVASGNRPHLLDVLKLTAVGLEADLSGASLAVEPELETDGTLRLSGDAAKLASTLSALLGEGYEDLTGSGPIAGSLRLKGSAAQNARRLTVDGTVNLASWKTGGLSLQGVRLEIVRPGEAAPLASTLSCVLNGGRSRLGATFVLGQKDIAWSGKLDVQGADTSTILVSQGLGRYLAFAFPALIPARAQQPVLSGRLMADVSASSSDVEAPALTDTLQGRGTIAMRQGEVRQSTLFGGGGGALTRVVDMLRTAVPEAGSVMHEVAKSVAFSSLDSQFAIANRKVDIQRASLRGRRVNVDMKGTVDFDLRVGVDANTTVLGSAGRELAKYVPNGVIPMRVGGTLDQPQVTPHIDPKHLVGNPLDKLPGLIDKIKKKKPKLPGKIEDLFK